MKYHHCFPVTVPQHGGDPIKILRKGPSLETVDDPLFNIPAPVIWDERLKASYYTFSSLSVGPIVVYAHGASFYLNGNPIAGIDISGYNGPFYFCDAVLNGIHYVVIMWASTVAVVRSSNGTVTTGSLGFNVGCNPVFLGGRVYVAGEYSRRLYNSAVGNLTSFTPSTDFIDAELLSGVILGLAIHRNHIVTFGTNGIEFFYDAAVDIGSPLQRQEAYANLIKFHKSISSIGNDIYFFGTVQDSKGVFRLRDFRIQKVSSPYIDHFINSSYAMIRTEAPPDESFIPVNPIYMDLFVASTGATPILGVSLLVDSRAYDTKYYQFPVVRNKYPFLFAYVIEEDVWVELSPPGGATPRVVTFSIPRGNNTIIHTMTTAEVGDIGLKDDPVVHMWEYRNAKKSSTIQEPTTSYMIFDTFDGGTELQKHIRQVDVVGDMGDNTVSLEFTKDSSKESLTYTAANDSSGDPVRFRNLCRAKRVNFKVTFTGRSQIEFRGLDIYYNQGTV